LTRLFITSTANARVKAARQLARHRRRHGVLLVEGHRQLRRALEAGAVVREVLAAPELFLGGQDAALVALAADRGAHVVELGAAAFRSVAAGVRPDGLAAVVERPPTTLARLRPPPTPLVLAADGLERPGNLGTTARTACCAGADALFVCDGRTDPFHPDAVRGSVGTVFQLALAECTSEDAVAWCAERGIRVVVATPEAPEPYWRADYTGAVAVVVGSERHGVGEAWRAAAAQTVAIPHPGPADSLNVAVAAGVVLFEAARQRAAADAPSQHAPPRGRPGDGLAVHRAEA
jgi:TrmH family RNA methyltransferase